MRDEEEGRDEGWGQRVGQGEADRDDRALRCVVADLGGPVVKRHDRGDEVEAVAVAGMSCR